MNGSFVMRILLVTVITVSCTQLIRGKSPALAMVISLAAVLVLSGLLLPRVQTVWQSFQQLLTQVGLGNRLFLPLFKLVGLTQITHISAEFCRDAGEKALAAKLELCGAAASLLCVLPLAEQALALIGALGA